MQDTTLVIMAAGLGSRFGKGIKQLEPIGPNDEIIMDYSIQHAIEAGFTKVVFVIRKDIEQDFEEKIGRRIKEKIKTEYVFQETEDIPEKFKKKYKNRTKPWGTGQAILCCKDVVNEPFLVINADDYYGKQSFELAYKELTSEEKKDNQIEMIGFILKNTLSENGGVTRGVCEVNKEGMLEKITETKNILKHSSKIMSEEKILDENLIVSMNMWCLYPSFFNTLEKMFDEFLKENIEDDNSNEYLLPIIIEELLKKKGISVKVLNSSEKWFGLTYSEDKEAAKNAVKNL